MIKHRRLLAALLVCLGLAALLTPIATATATPVAIAAAKPVTIPALQEWTAGGRPYTFGASSRILVEPDHAGALSADATTFAEDIADLTGRRPAVLAASRHSARAGDIVLTLGSPDAALGEQGYTMTVDATVVLAARTATGAFHGTRSVLQLLRTSTTIPGGTARDWSQYPERGVLIDTVPRGYSKDWWHNLIRELSYLKMNQLDVALLGPRGLTKAEILDLTAFSEKYHVNLTPWLSMPSHAFDTLRRHPEYRLANDPDNPLTREAFDFTKPGALEIVRSEIERWIDLFPGRTWSTGADEYMKFPYWLAPTFDDFPQFKRFAQEKTGNPAATSYDAYVWFLNYVNSIVKEHGKTLRAWNDTLQSTGVLRLDKDIEIEFWIRPYPVEKTLTPQDHTDPASSFGGHKLLNASMGELYYDSGLNLLDPRGLYNTFDVTRFNALNGRDVVTGEATKNLLGARLQAWMYSAPGKPDDTNEELAANLERPLRSLAQKVWGSPKLTGSYDEFITMMEDVGQAPGWVRTSKSDAVGTPVTALDADRRLNSLVTTASGRLLQSRQTEPGSFGWTSPQVIGTKITGTPALRRDVTGRLVFVARTTDGRLVTGRQGADGSWSAGATTIRTGVTGDPVLLADSLQRLAVVAPTAGAVWYGVQTAPAGHWSGSDLATSTTSTPSAVVAASGKVTVLAVDPDGRVVAVEESAAGSGRFGSPVVLTDGASGDLVVALDNDKKVTYFVRRENGQLVHGWQREPGGPWDPATAVLVEDSAGRPAVALDADGRLTLLVRTTAQQLIHRRQAVAGGGWVPGQEVLYGDLGGDPVVTTDAQDKLTLVVRRNDGLLIHKQQTALGGAWSPGAAFLATNLVPNAAPALTLDGTGRLTSQATATFGYVFNAYQKEPSGSFSRSLVVGALES
ncbi:hypothetical protein E1218_30890 [Kribbella turkmenica]|uniref:Uncharacterized protein n=1 Tax=Kribbella turkmenica TaxID=2530375 RepID=A0A4R4WHL0_9ACTN|nr:glycoside hydrolase family 20 zincin-like fold domain-containing protein [Kribbella turkmenica]TDD15814.1 hypothetical protein E1218_30890 [Kribbella turkmenica]